MKKAIQESRYSKPARHLPGGIFCAPWCGANCTKREHDRAQKEAYKLALRMQQAYPGVKWVTRVWENLGWHYQISGGAFEVHVMKDRNIPGGRHCWRILSYSAWLQTSPQIIGDDKATPEVAVQDLLAKAEKVWKEVCLIRKNVVKLNSATKIK